MAFLGRTKDWVLELDCLDVGQGHVRLQLISPPPPPNVISPCHLLLVPSCGLFWSRAYTSRTMHCTSRAAMKSAPPGSHGLRPVTITACSSSDSSKLSMFLTNRHTVKDVAHTYYKRIKTKKKVHRTPTRNTPTADIPSDGWRRVWPEIAEYHLFTSISL